MLAEAKGLRAAQIHVGPYPGKDSYGGHVHESRTTMEESYRSMVKNVGELSGNSTSLPFKLHSIVLLLVLTRINKRVECRILCPSTKLRPRVWSGKATTWNALCRKTRDVLETYVRDRLVRDVLND